VDDARFPCLLSSPLGDGERLLVVPLPQGKDLDSLILATLRISDFHGIMECQTSWLKSEGYAEIMAAARGIKPIGPLPVSLDEAKRVLAETAAINPDAGTPVPHFAERLLRWFRVEPRPAPDLPVPTEEDALVAAQGQLLHLELEVQPWIPAPEIRETLEQCVVDVLTSQDPPTAEAREQLCRENLYMVAAQAITPGVRRLMGRRLWNLADFFERSGRPEQARLARAEAKRQYHDVPEGPTPFENGIFQKLLLRVQIRLSGREVPPPDQPLPGLAEALAAKAPPGTLN
jgi:hypothetical protein